MKKGQGKNKLKDIIMPIFFSPKPRNNGELFSFFVFAKENYVSRNG